MNPAMSSWVALRRRVPLQPGQSVLVLGATGNAGTMAVQVAKPPRRGTGGRRRPRRGRLESAHGSAPTTSSSSPTTPTRRRGAWRAAAECRHRHRLPLGRAGRAGDHGPARPRGDRSRALDWIQIGAMAGPTIELPSAALRSANLRSRATARGRLATGLSGRTPFPDRRDRRRHHRRHSLGHCPAGRRRGRVWNRPVVPGERTVSRPLANLAGA